MRTATQSHVLAWLLVVVWAGLIFGLSSEPNLRFMEDAGLDFVVRKAGHMGVFGILALIAGRALGITMSWQRTRTWGVALVLTIAYAASDEIHQGFVNGRHPSPVDVAIDAIGAVLAIVLMEVVVRTTSRGRTPAD